MYFIGLDVHKKTISYCVKDAAGCVSRRQDRIDPLQELDEWIPKAMPEPRTIAMEATIFHWVDFTITCFRMP